MASVRASLSADAALANADAAAALPRQVQRHERLISAGAGALLVALLVTPLDVIKTRLQKPQAPPQPHRTPGISTPDHVFSSHNNLKCPDATLKTQASANWSRSSISTFFSSKSSPFSHFYKNTVLLPQPNKSVASLSSKSICCNLTGNQMITSYFSRECCRGPKFKDIFLNPNIGFNSGRHLSTLGFANGSWPHCAAADSRCPVGARGVQPKLNLSQFSSFVDAPSIAFRHGGGGKSCQISDQGLINLRANAPFFDAMRAKLSSFRTKRVFSRQSQTSKDVFISIVRHEGIHALWRGLTATLVLAIPRDVIYYYGYESINKTLSQNLLFAAYPEYVPFFAGASARVMATFCVAPVELLRTQMQATVGKSVSLIDSTAAIWKAVRSPEIGLRYAFRGVGPTLWRDVPFSALYWTCYENLRAAILPAFPKNSPYTASFVSGVVAGGLVAAITTPFDVAKTRRQLVNTAAENQIKTLSKCAKTAFEVNHGSASAVGNGQGNVTQACFNSNTQNNSGRILPAASSSETSTFSRMKEIAKSEGKRALFRGMLPRVAKVGASCGIMIGTFEYCKQYFRTRNEDNYNQQGHSST